MQEDAKTRQSRVYELEDLSTTRWADHDTKNALLRRNFRKEKRQRISRQLSDAALRERIGWSSDRILASEHSDQPVIQHLTSNSNGTMHAMHKHLNVLRTSDFAREASVECTICRQQPEG